ncbi:hypothetical protein Glove_124g24 [Diversispora epigaea]|uniref:Kinesin-like protein n=1 Tax=Diversispora epigaea TaxID=1348612 RepID=A0A397J796_9GLOM|nr:hypothetical protein Glove_124g24 [Diversispora epigaea]
MSANNRKASRLPTSRIQFVLNSPRKIKNAQAPLRKLVGTTEGKRPGAINKNSSFSLKKKNTVSIIGNKNVRSVPQKASLSNGRSIPFESSYTKKAPPTNGSFKNVRSRIQYPPPPPPLPLPPSPTKILKEQSAALKAHLQELYKEKEYYATINAQKQNEIQEIRRAQEEYIEEIENKNQRIIEVQAHRKELEGEIETVMQQTDILLVEKKELISKIDSHKNELETKQNTIKQQAETIESNSNYIQELTSNLQDRERERRDLHNLLQDLKGNIRVFCRVRPPLPSESNDLAVLKFPKELPVNKRISIASIKINYLGKKREQFKDYEFDQVFDHEATQKDVFNEVSHVVQSVVDGYNGCIFAYGQTGAGKTYTMAGPSDPTPETEGMIPRAVGLIYDLMQNLKAQHWKFKMEGQFIEIYNDSIRDLLAINPSSSSNIKYKTAHDENTGTTQILNARTVNLDSPETLNRVLKAATQNRAVAATKCNARSSRSHSVFMIRLIGTNENLNETRVGSLNLIDLAGSERLSKSESKGNQLQEAKHINSSLSHLKTVIEGIRKDSSHVNFRDSPLTWLLKNSLGGKAKVLMLVNISPLEYSRSETESSLDFATHVNSTHVGSTIRKN